MDYCIVLNSLQGALLCILGSFWSTGCPQHISDVQFSVFYLTGICKIHGLWWSQAALETAQPMDFKLLTLAIVNSTSQTWSRNG